MDFDDLLDYGIWDTITFQRGDEKKRFVFLDGFFAGDNESYCMLLLDDDIKTENQKIGCHGCICTRELWPCVRSPQTEEEWKLVEERFRMIQNGWANTVIEDEEEDEDIRF